jgi:methionyl-tRNA synthetase
MTSIQPLADALNFPVWVVALAIIWTLVWKGLALWRAALLRHKKWFIAMLVLNTLGILEIVYLFVVARKYQVLVEVVEEK